MISPQAPADTMTPNYDPLASQFLTGGRMGYMPQSQMMTSSQYGAFRTMPGSNMSQMPTQRPSLWQAYMETNRGQLPFDIGPEYLINTWRQGVDQAQHRTMMQRRLQDAQSAMGGTLTDIGSSMAVGGAVGGLPGMALGMAAPSVSGPYMDRLRQSRRIQDQTMSKITVGPDMAKGLGQGFSAGAAQDIDERVRGMAADDVMFKEEDYRKIMQVGMEHGLFDYSSRSHEYKRVIKNLRNNMNTMMEVLGSTDFKELMGNMDRMMKMGADINQMQGIGRQEHMFARMTGMRHQDMVDTYGQQGALAYSQAGLTNYQGSLANMSNAAQLTMSKRLGLVDPGQLARQGGISGWTQDITDQQANVRRKLGKYILPYVASDDFSSVDSEKVQKLISGDVDIFDAMKEGAGKIQSAEQMAKFQSKRAALDEQFGEETGAQGFEIATMRTASAVGRQMGAKSREDALRLGYTQLGFKPETVDLKTKQWTDEDFVNSKMEQLKVEQRRMNLNARDQSLAENTIFNKVLRGTRSTFHDIMESTYGEFAQDRTARKQYEEDKALGVVKNYGTEALKAGGVSELSDEEMLYYGGKPGGTELARKINRIDEAAKFDVGGIKASDKEKKAFIEQSQWAEAFEGLDPESKEFKQLWKKVANENPEEFRQDQQEFIKDKFYSGITRNLQDSGMDLTKKSKTVQDLVSNMGRRFGADKGSQVVKQALQGEDVDELSEEDIVNAVYDQAEISGEEGDYRKERRKLLAKKLVPQDIQEAPEEEYKDFTDITSLMAGDFNIEDQEAFIKQSQWADEFKGLEVGSEEWNQRLREVKYKDTGEFEQAKKDFSKGKVDTQLEEMGVDLEGKSQTLRNKIFAVTNEQGIEAVSSALKLSDEQKADFLQDSKWKDKFKGLEVGSEEFDKLWSKLREDSDEFKKSASQYKLDETSDKELIKSLGDDTGKALEQLKLENRGTVSEDEVGIDYSKMGSGSYGYSGRYGYAPTRGDDKQRADKFKNMHIALKASEGVSETDRNKMYKEFSDDFTEGALKSTVSEEIEDTSDLTSSNLKNVLATSIQKSQQISREDAEEKADKLFQEKGGQIKRLIGSEATTNNEEFLSKLSLEFQKESEKVFDEQYEKNKERRDELESRLGELTEQGWFGTDSGEDTDLLNKTIEKDIKSLDVFGSQALLQKYWEGDVTEDQQKKIKTRLRQQFKRLGLSEEDVQRVIKTGSLESVQGKLAENLGISKEDVKELGAAGRRKGADLGHEDIGEFLGQLKEQGKGWTKFTLNETQKRIREKFKDFDISMSDLRKEGGVSELLEKDYIQEDKDLVGVLKRAQAIRQNDDRNLNMRSLTRFSADVFSGENVRETIKGSVKAGEESNQQRMQQNIEALDGVLSNLSSNTDENTRVLKNLNTTTKNANQTLKDINRTL